MAVAAQSHAREHAFALPTVTASVPDARRRARRAFTSWGLDPHCPVVHAALVALTELFTNSVKHAREFSARAEVVLALTAEHLVISVHDRHPHCPAVLSRPHAHGVGWGLRLVAGLAAEVDGSLGAYGDADGQGKSMVVRLAGPARFAAPAPVIAP